MGYLEEDLCGNVNTSKIIKRASYGPDLGKTTRGIKVGLPASGSLTT